MSPVAGVTVTLLGWLKADRRGVTALEYGILLAALILVILGSLNVVGSSLSTEFTNIGSMLHAH